MNSPRNPDNSLEEVLSKVHECIANDEPLSKELVRSWLQANGLSYIWLGKQMRCSESTIKNWLCTDKGIPQKREEELRRYILAKTICDQSFDIWKISITPDEDYEEKRLARSKEEDGKWVYTLPHMFHEVLKTIADKRFKTVSELISDVLYSYVIWHQSKEQAPKAQKNKIGETKYETGLEASILKAEDKVTQLNKVIKSCTQELEPYEQKETELKEFLKGIEDEALKKQLSKPLADEIKRRKDEIEQHEKTREAWRNILNVLQMSATLP